MQKRDLVNHVLRQIRKFIQSPVSIYTCNHKVNSKNRKDEINRGKKAWRIKKTLFICRFLYTIIIKKHYNNMSHIPILTTMNAQYNILKRIGRLQVQKLNFFWSHTKSLLEFIPYQIFNLKNNEWNFRSRILKV